MFFLSQQSRILPNFMSDKLQVFNCTHPPIHLPVFSLFVLVRAQLFYTCPGYQEYRRTGFLKLDTEQTSAVTFFVYYVSCERPDNSGATLQMLPHPSHPGGSIPSCPSEINTMQKGNLSLFFLILTLTCLVISQ